MECEPKYGGKFMDDERMINISNIIYAYLENFNTDNLDVFIKNMVNNIVQKLSLQDYIGHVHILEVYDKEPATKGMLDNEGNICVFREGIEKKLSAVLEELPGLSEYEINLCRCLLYVKTIIHELEHVNQKKLLTEDSENSTLETLIIRLCDAERSKDGFFYYCLYASYPTERLAELKAFRIITKVIESLEAKFDIEMLSFYMKKQAILEEFHNYWEYGLTGPTEHYFSVWNNEGFSVLQATKANKN